jgi:predicted transcriptional regulator
MREADTGLGPLETDVMRILWASSEALTVRDVLDRLNRRRRPKLAYTTVMTVLSRLVEKDVLHRTKTGRRYAYQALAGDPGAVAVRRVIRDFGPAAVAHFLEEARGDPALLASLRRLMKR